MQSPDYGIIFSTKRYEVLFAFSRGLSRGRSRFLFCTSFKKTLNALASKKTIAAGNTTGKGELYMGMSKVNTLLQKIVRNHLFDNVTDLERVAPKESDRYLLLKIFSENDEYGSLELEKEVVESFAKLSVEYLAKRKTQFSGSFQQIVELMRDVIDELDMNPK